MGIRVALNHKTTYTYDRPVSLSPHVIRLRPAPHSRTPIHAYSIRITPEKHFANWQQDPQSNYILRTVFPDKTRELSFEVDLIADMTVINPFDFFLEPHAEEFPFNYEEWLASELRPFLRTGEQGPLFERYLEDIDKTPRHSVDFVVEINQKLQQHISYLIRLEPGVQTPEETLKKGSGSCRDSSWLLVQLLRRLGLAARFVSGYLIQLTADVKSLDGPSGPEADFTDLHAWAEVYLPGAGWIGLDPTSGLLCGEGHIPLAATPDPTSAAPITGMTDKCEVDFHYEMSVRRIHEDPRVTKPYTEEQWRTIQDLGIYIDMDLKRHDVRLTMGGEPTFVSIDDMDGEEWNTAALGEDKRRLAGVLFRRLYDKFGKGGLLHYGQGKWYPGESLPRWALTCYWRRDGQPVWPDDSLTARDGKDYGHDSELARQFIEAVAVRLDVDPNHTVPAWEDPWHYIMKERRLPANVDPFDSKLENEEDRARLARIFEQGLDHIVGYALPLSKGLYGHDPHWISGAWFFRQERMYLIPGDSPMGFRLPLDSLPWVAEDDQPFFEPEDPSKPKPDLAHPSQRQQFLTGVDREGRLDYRLMEQSWPDPMPEASSHDYLRGSSSPWVMRTALCVEPRNGVLHVFLPPARKLEDFLELIDAIHDVSEKLQTPVRIEGYTPPSDHRINSFRVTPDPGVIEVNIHPAHNWTELVENTTTLYQEARLTRLGTEKFMLDGRHTGTGGGNHVVIGGASPADSPLLRRPDVLRSLIGFWVNHPSLSYLFSGTFIGPTSQAPRVDEGRADAIYELQIAFDQIPDQGHVPPWLVDRVFRNLLVDVSGNTHRAEFCIDKLYSPDSASGRLGLLELRAFEMPPHSRMSLTQALLLRGLIAMFWQRPYREKLVRWRTELYDRFLLPHYVEEDFADVIFSLNDFGYPFQEDWFAPHFEFRFPHYGTIVRCGTQLSLRQAIEPWHVLGEETGGGGTVRFVDSSVERLEAKVTGMVDDRHVLLCNGRRVPLRPTGVNGEFVAGIRYRAWQPPSCMHPTIGVHAPLVFDIHDTWNKRSIGGCTYHVAHPGGRNYETFPVNANEAEARRVARFFAIGHTPATIAPPEENVNPDYPHTLDLRSTPR